MFKDGLTDLEKRLISLSNLGIIIEHSSGHRWIYSKDTESFDFNLELEKHGVCLNNKIYGSLIDTLDIIDKCLELIGHKSLLESYWMDIEDILFKHTFDESRIDVREPNNGGIY